MSVKDTCVEKGAQNGSLDDCTSFLALEEWHESVRESYHAHIIDQNLMLDLSHIHCFRLAEVHDILHSCVQENAIEIGMSFGDAK